MTDLPLIHIDRFIARMQKRLNNFSEEWKDMQRSEGRLKYPSNMTELFWIGRFNLLFDSLLDKPQSEELDAEIVKFLEGIYGVVEADSYSQHMLWVEYHHEADVGKYPRDPLSWEQVPAGLLETVGHIKIGDQDLPVCISLSKVVVDGKPILFWHVTSRVADHELVEQWMQKYIPESARYEDGRINRSDAMNFCNVLRK